MTDPPVGAIICRLGFHASWLETFMLIVHYMSSFLWIRSVDQQQRSVYFEVRSWYISQTNQVGYEDGGGTVNYIV